MAEFDLVIRSGTVVDGNGGAPRKADVAVRDGTIVEVGEVSGHGEREIDAEGLIVGPGFVDIHTHYDGQAIWDDRLQPSSWNYFEGNLDAVRAMLTHPYTLPGLGDGGAHVGSICDSSFTSTLLQYWVRDRPYGKLPVEFVFQRQSRDTARMVGLDDRGELTPGHRADIIVVDLENMRIHRPEVVYDLPGGGRRFQQWVEGYQHTFVNGVETYRDGVPTGALPGRLVRGAQGSPRAVPEAAVV
jgi:N-acyl-D-aspartate/D-glutamate deacylase